MAERDPVVVVLRLTPEEIDALLEAVSFDAMLAEKAGGNPASSALLDKLKLALPKDDVGL